MNGDQPPGTGSLPLSLAERVDEACDRFEKAWKDGLGPRIEEYLAEVPEPDRVPLFRELLALEIELRSGGPEGPTPEEYRRRFPGHVELIEAVFAQASCDGSGRPPDSGEGATTPHNPPAPQSAGDAGPPPPSGSPPAVPDRISRYRVVRRLGAGTYGDVYLAHDEVMDRPVAIKVPSARLLATERAREEFLREARSVARLQHEGIVRAYDFGQEPDGRCYIVYEFVEGMSLAERIKPERLAADPLPPEAATRIVALVAEALHYAHLQGWVHRDVKPANILLDRQGKPKVTDFGLAVREEELAGERGRLAGTLPYMSPEQVRREGHRLDGRSDIYSLGVVLYELLCGRRPFTATTQDELSDQILNREARPPRQIKDSIPAELERVCLKALSKRINDRYTTAKDMADELRAAIPAERSLKTTPPPLQRGVPKAQDELLSPIDITEDQHESKVEHGEALNLPADRTVANPHAYKLVVKSLLQTKLMDEGLATLRAFHLKSYKGRSGRMHEVDVSFEIQVGELELLFIAGCNDSGRKVTVDEIMAFSYCLRDIGAHKGLLVSTIGFDHGTVELARTERIALLIARKGRLVASWLGECATYKAHWVHRFGIVVKEKESELQVTGLRHVTCNSRCDAVPFETSSEHRPEGGREFGDEYEREFGDLVYYLLPEEMRSDEHAERPGTQEEVRVLEALRKLSETGEKPGESEVLADLLRSWRDVPRQVIIN
jgi:serine/threonine protein kinase